GREGLRPVAARGTGAQQPLFHHVLTVLGHELPQPLDAGDAAAAFGALEDDGGVVLALGSGLEVAPARHPGPFAEEVNVAGVVHLVHEVRAARAAADLAEHHLAVGFAEPLHVGEAVAHAQGVEHAAAELDAGLQARLVHVAYGDDDRAHRLHGAGDDGRR